MKTISLILVALLGLAACGAVENAIDCHKICGRYQSCFDRDYDVGKCDSTCRSNAGKDKDYEGKVNKCEACIDDQSCAAATFDCTADCSTVVP